jgi:hypothetical protein
VAGYLDHLANGAATMKSEKILEPFGLQEFYVDGFGNFRLSNGILRCAAFSQQQAPGGRTQSIAVFRLIVPAAGARPRLKPLPPRLETTSPRCIFSNEARIIRLRKERLRAGSGILPLSTRCRGRRRNPASGDGAPVESGRRFRRGIFHAASDLMTPCLRSRPPWPRRPVS